MKKSLLFFASLLGFGPLNATTAVITPESLETSPCKSNYAPARADANDDSNYGPQEISASVAYNDGKLTLSVINLWEQCCPMFQITADVDTPGEIHFIVDDKAEAVCDCMCSFDVTATYEGILSGHYTVYLENGWHTILLQKEIDIEEGCLAQLVTENSVKSINQDDNLLRFNPDGYVYVNLAGDTNVDIFNADGQLIHRIKTHGPAEVSVSTLPAGIYVMRATNDTSRSVLRFSR